MARGRTKVIKYSAIPNSPKDRELLDAYLNEGVSILKTRDRTTKDLKDVMENLSGNESKLRLDKRYAAKLLRVRYDQFKIKAMVSDLQTALDDSSVLTGSSKQEA